MKERIGFRVRSERSLADPSTIEALGRFDTVYLSDAMHHFNGMDGSVQPVIPGTRFVGSALTVRPATGDSLALYMALDRAQPGDVVVIESRRNDIVAQWGDLASAVAKAKGVRAVVLDGSIRDKEGIIGVGVPVFASPVVVSQGGVRHGPGEINVPVAVGGIAVMPGDVLVGDGNGVVVIPADQADQVAVAAADVAAADQEKMARAGDPDYLSWIPDAEQAAGYEGAR